MRVTLCLESPSLSDEVAFMHMHIYYLRLRYTHCSAVVTIHSIHTTYPVSSYNTQYAHYIPGLQLQYAVCTIHTRSPVTIRSMHTTYPVSFIIGLVQKVMPYLNKPLLKRLLRYLLGLTVYSRHVPASILDVNGLALKMRIFATFRKYSHSHDFI